MANEIVDNKDEYSNKSIFYVIPKLSKKLIHGHYDSVDFTALIMILEEELNKYNVFLKSTIFEF